MGKQTNISWTDHTHNWWWGCNKVTEKECGGCYAEFWARFTGFNGNTKPVIWGPPISTPRHILSDKHAGEPYGWNSDAMRRGERECVFTESMSDLFEFHPQLDAPRKIAFRTVENTTFLDWKLLTKRPQLIARYVPQQWLTGAWPLNAWMGFSAGNQQYFDERMPAVVDLPAPVIFVSHEPAVGPVNIEALASRVDPKRLWIITGGTSGPRHKKYPMDLAWARYMRDQCAEMGIAFFYKQASAPKPGTDPELDGVLHHEWPTVPGVPGILGGVRRAALAA